MDNVVLLSNPGFLPLFSIDYSTIIFTLINTGVIVLAYRFFLHKPVMNMLEKRKEAVKAELDAASEAKENALATEKEFNALLADSKSQADKIVSAAIQKAHSREEEIIREAENAVLQIRQKAEEDVERERKRTVNEIKNQIAELVVMAAGKVAEKEINEADNAALIENFLVNTTAE
ncbi:MAG: F0F1 ATP synthase subunit B [Oscillospiraceae bacterium]|nr:F0F1 ATP synthase subunit B [Oscillospiraceae bacterium]